MLTPETIRAEVKRRIAAAEAGDRSFDCEYTEALEELEQWIAAQMAKQAELAKHQSGEG